MTDHFLARMAGPKWKDVWQLTFDEQLRKKMESEGKDEIEDL